MSGCTFENGWTDDRTAMLKRLWAEGHSCSEIARTIGFVTRNAVIGKVHRLGLPGRGQTTSKVCATLAAKKKTKKRDRLVSTRLEYNELKDIRELDGEPAALTLVDGSTIGAREILPFQCSWPHGDPRDTNAFHFCGQPVLPARRYCRFHHEISYIPSVKRA